MICRQLYAWCVLGAVVSIHAGFPTSSVAQQPEAPARARIRTAPLTQPAGQSQTGGNAAAGKGAQPRVARPAADSIESKLPPELEQLLDYWERESAKWQKLHGEVIRYHYDSVYGVEKRAAGEFWYTSPDMGRIDLGPVQLPDPPENPKKTLANGKPFTIQCEDRQRWICDGKMISIINDDKRIADQVQIPATQQGKNIMNSPLPFLFGMKAEQAKERYHLGLGNKHWPTGIVQLKGGGQAKVTPQIHIVAAPKYKADAAEWSRAEVLLNPNSFLPTAIRLIHPHDSSETVYEFRGMKVNDLLWINNPFNDKPPSSYTIGQPTRATADETPAPAPK